MKTKLMVLFLLMTAGSAVAYGRVFIGFGVAGWGAGWGPFYPAPVVAYPPVVAPYAPAAYAGFGYTWVPGYYYPVGASWSWRAGYWVPRPWVGAVWGGNRRGRSLAIKPTKGG
jgi:WXXGXW repeat (2 copies)